MILLLELKIHFLKNLKILLFIKFYNIGNSNPVKLLDFIDSIEKNLSIKAKKKMLPMQAGDVNKTWADVSRLQKDYNYEPNTSVDEGVEKFIKWFKSYYK